MNANNREDIVVPKIEPENLGNLGTTSPKKIKNHYFEEKKKKIIFSAGPSCVTQVVARATGGRPEHSLYKIKK